MKRRCLSNSLTSRCSEFGEKALRLDSNDITAMMILARNYAIESKNIDRALELAQRAVVSAVKMRSAPPPAIYSESQWKDYLQSNEDAAGQYVEEADRAQRRLSGCIRRSSQMRS